MNSLHKNENKQLVYGNKNKNTQNDWYFLFIKTNIPNESDTINAYFSFLFVFCVSLNTFSMHIVLDGKLQYSPNKNKMSVA